MKNLLAPAIALMLGIGLGILITKSMGSANAVHVAESQSPDDGTASNLRTRPSSRTSSAGKSTTGQTAASPRSLAGLLGLVGDKWNAQPSIAFLEAVEGLDAGEITALMSDLEKFDPNDARRSRLCNALINRWAAIDPDGAWDAAMKFDDKNLKRQMITSVIGVISRSDLGKARQLLSGIKDQQIKQNALYSFINQAATQDPEEAFRMLTSDSENTQNYSHHYQALFQKWAKEDPEAAIAKLNLIKGNSERQQALQGIAVALVTSDPQRALDLLDGTPPGQSRASMLSSITSAWMSHDSDAAIAWINSLPAADRSKAVQNGCWQLIQEDPAKASKFLASLPANSQTNQQFSQLAGQWAQQDLEAAQKWVESLPAGQRREQAMSGIIGTLAQADPAKAATLLGGAVVTNQNSHQVGMIVGAWVKTDQPAALAWLDSLGLKGDAQRNIYSQFMQNWGNEDAPAAGRYALGIEDEKTRQQAITSLVGVWGNDDPQATREWIMKSLDGDTKNRSLNSLIQTLTYQDYSTALRYYQEATANLAPESIEKTFGSTASQIASSWVQNDPKAAGQWVMSLPEGKTRSNSIRSMVDSFGDYDIKGTAEFVNTLAVGKERDQAVGALVSDLGHQGDPESAFDWATSISDSSTRESMIRNAANQWKEYDRAAAQAAVNSANISNEAKTDILKELNN